MTRCYVMSNSPFKATSAAYGTLRDDGRAFDQWEIEYRAESGAVEVRDAARNILFVGKQPFKLVPAAGRGSILIKSARLLDSVGVDPGDREVRGAVEVFPNPWGFKLVNEAPLELYLYGVASLALPDGSPPEAYKAEAVAARTAAAWAMGHRPENLERTDLLDDASVQPTIGVSGELRAAQEAVAATEAMVLAEGAKVARVAHHDDSGGRTAQGDQYGEPGWEHLVSVRDSARPLEEWRSPLDLERFVHEPPPQGLYSEAVSGFSPAASRWLRILDARELRSRIERRKDIGALRRVRVAARTGTGRVQSLEVEGSRGAAVFTGAKEIEEFLSPGSLRSTLFSIQPLYDGKDISRLVVWGAGTGSGLGMPRAGAAGQAALGADWKTILKHYFPKLALRSLDRPPEAAKAPPRGLGPYRRTLNFRKQKK